MPSSETTTRRRGRMCRDRKVNVGILVVLGQLLLSRHVAVSMDTSSTLLSLTQKTHEVPEYFPLQRRRLLFDIEAIENITIANSDDLEKIYALAREIAARDTRSPVATPVPTVSQQLETPAPQATTSSPQAPSPVIQPTTAPVAPSQVAPSLSPTKIPAGGPTPTLGSASPTKSPANAPSVPSIAVVSQFPSDVPSIAPSGKPSGVGLPLASDVPSIVPSGRPSGVALAVSSDVPSIVPSGRPSGVVPGTSLTTKPPSFSLQTPSISATGSDAPSLTPSFFLGLNSTPATGTIVTGNSTVYSNSTWACAKKPVSKNLVILPYVYAMETDVLYEVSKVRLALEEVLNLDLAPMLLDCSATRRRYLLSKSGIVAIDWLPVDVPSSSLKCNADSPNDVCNVFVGQMTLYISNTSSIATVAEEAKLAIEAVFRVIVVAGLVKVTYLGSDQLSAASALQDTNSTGGVNQVTSNGTLGPSAITLFVTGSAALVAAMGVFVYLRQKRSARGEASGAATQAAGTDTASAEYFNARRPTSPFSEMLPSAYRFDHDMNMSAILETDEESQARSELLVSEGWVSDNDTTSSIDVPSVNYSRITATPVLGARKRQQETPPAEPFELCSL